MTIELIFVVLNFAVGNVAVALMLWAFYGFRHTTSPRVIWRTICHPNTSGVSELLSISVTLYHITTIARTSAWDVVMLSRAILNGSAVDRALYIASINIPIGVLASVASLFALGAQYRNIPAAERQYYNWMTAPLYPWSKIERRRARAAAQTAASSDTDPVTQLRHALINCETERDTMVRYIREQNWPRAIQAANFIAQKGDAK